MTALNRRHALLGSLVVALPAQAASPAAGRGRRYRAVAFDGFPIFDLRPVAAEAEAVFPGKGAELIAVWRTRQFEYQWLRALSHDYTDFWQATQDSLTFAGRALRLELDDAARARLLGAFTRLPVWPDVPEALGRIRQAGLRVVIVSNMNQRLLDDGLARAGLSQAFDHVLSTDPLRSYKPDPRAYRLAVDALGLRREEIVFAPFAGWDAAGAKAFGYPTFWINRLGAPAEELGRQPDGKGKDMADLIQFLQLAVG